MCSDKNRNKENLDKKRMTTLMKWVITSREWTLTEREAGEYRGRGRSILRWEYGVTRPVSKKKEIWGRERKTREGMEGGSREGGGGVKRTVGRREGGEEERTGG